MQQTDKESLRTSDDPKHINIILYLLGWRTRFRNVGYSSTMVCPGISSNHIKVISKCSTYY